jgi:hypothetical protein
LTTKPPQQTMRTIMSLTLSTTFCIRETLL